MRSETMTMYKMSIWIYYYDSRILVPKQNSMTAVGKQTNVQNQPLRLNKREMQTPH